jgi:hypothetical protein
VLSVAQDRPRLQMTVCLNTAHACLALDALDF